MIEPLATKMQRALGPLPQRIERSLEVGTPEQMREDLHWLKGHVEGLLLSLETHREDEDELSYAAPV